MKLSLSLPDEYQLFEQSTVTLTQLFDLPNDHNTVNCGGLLS